MTVRIGLTGPIACGKSTVAGWLGEMGAEVIDADALARVVVEPGTDGLRAVFDSFGDRVRAPDGSLDRGALGAIVFADPEALRRLEAIIQPGVRLLIRDAIGRAEAAHAPAVVIEAIKLIEGGLAQLCDEVWLVDCPPDEQRRRLIGRGSSETDAAARMSSQGDIRARVGPWADRVIETSGSLDEVRDRVAEAYANATRPTSGPGGGEARRVSGA